MTIRVYLLLATLAFVVAVTGSDVFARMTIAGATFGDALVEHLRWVLPMVIGVVLLFIPFAGTALICGGANRRARTRGAAAIFGLAMAVLGYFYFDGFQTAQHAALAQQWTAATLSVGLLPFFVGIPVLTIVAVAALVIMRFDRCPPRTAAR